VSTQPEALRLADALEASVVYGYDDTAAAAELRRQHAEIKRLTAAWNRQHARMVEEQAEAKLWFENAQKVKEVNAELLEALRHLLTAVTFADPPKAFNGALCHEARVPVGFVDAARAAIAKAEEVKP
jgi:hypothetical protein